MTRDIKQEVSAALCPKCMGAGGYFVHITRMTPTTNVYHALRVSEDGETVGYWYPCWDCDTVGVRPASPADGAHND